MGRKKKKAEARPPIPWRIKMLIIGVVLGVLWGVAMWVLGGVINDDFEARKLIILAMYSGMIGGGVAAIFGIFGAKKRGEKVFAKLPYRKWKGRG